MSKIKNFTKSNKWTNLRKKYKGPFEREVLDYLELLEKQITVLDEFVNSIMPKGEEANDES